MVSLLRIGKASDGSVRISSLELDVVLGVEIHKTNTIHPSAKKNYNTP